METENGAEEGERLREQAIEDVELGNVGFVQRAVQAVLQVAQRELEFTSDDVWFELGAGSGDAEPRAMGAVMRNAGQLGYCEPINAWRLSRRAACHRRPVRVWRSLLPSGAS
jgi:hypothetical protein